MKRAWLYCTFEFVDPGHKYPQPLYIGEVTDEGSLHDHIKRHCAQETNEHADHIHLIVEGSPEYHELAESMFFPHFLPSGWRPRETVR